MQTSVDGEIEVGGPVSVVNGGGIGVVVFIGIGEEVHFSGGGGVVVIIGGGVEVEWEGVDRRFIHGRRSD